jgi:hypothetical protein
MEIGAFFPTLLAVAMIAALLLPSMGVGSRTYSQDHDDIGAGGRINSSPNVVNCEPSCRGRAMGKGELLSHPAIERILYIVSLRTVRDRSNLTFSQAKDDSLSEGRVWPRAQTTPGLLRFWHESLWSSLAARNLSRLRSSSIRGREHQNCWCRCLRHRHRFRKPLWEWLRPL